MNRILITGGAGSIAKLISSSLLESDDYSDSKIHLLDNDDTELYEVSKKNHSYENISYHLDDITSSSFSDSLKRINPDIIIHSAAHKQVSFLEQFPERAYLVNTLASSRLFDYCSSNNIKMIFISSDKAVEPISILGKSKWLAEIAFLQKFTPGLILRLPNIENTRGSFFSTTEINKHSEFVPITDLNCSRFIFKQEQFQDFFLNSLNVLKTDFSGTLVPSNLNPIKIVDYIKNELLLSNSILSFKEVGLRNGEKIHEKLTWDFEDSCTFDHHFKYIDSELSRNHIKSQYGDINLNDLTFDLLETILS